MICGRLDTGKVIVTIIFGDTCEGGGTMANILAGMVTCEIVLTNVCGGSSVDIWLMCNGKGVGSDIMIH